MMMMIMMMMMLLMMMMIIDHRSHIHTVHLHIESPPTWHFRNMQPFRNSGAEQRQGCTVQFSWAGFQPTVYMGRTWELHGFIADVLGI